MKSILEKSMWDITEQVMSQGVKYHYVEDYKDV